MHAGKNLFLCVGLLAENYVLDRIWCLLSGFKGVRFADFASLVKPKYCITDLLIWFTVLLVLVSFFNCLHLLFVIYDIGSDGKVTLWERAARSVYIMFSVPFQVLTRATFIIVDCMLR